MQDKIVLSTGGRAKGPGLKLKMTLFLLRKKLGFDF
jgi:hypothetical protein